MSADQTTADDRKDAEFRARLAPLASEVLPGGAKHSVTATEGARPRALRRLTARAGVARDTTSPTGSPAAGTEISAVASRIAPRRLVGLAGIVIAIGAAGVAWLYPRTPGNDKPVIGAIFMAMPDARGIAIGTPDSALPAVPLPANGISGVVTSGADSGNASSGRPAGVADQSSGISGKPAGEGESAASVVPDPVKSPLDPVVISRGEAAGPPDKVSGTAPSDPEMPNAIASDAMVSLLLQRGNASLAVGDIIAARLLFERAAALGSAAAAMSIGRTYDSDFLLRSGARGIRADPSRAAAWFRRALVLGDPAARGPLERIEAQSRR